MTTPPCDTCPALDAATNVAHGFFGRRGGVSTGIYAGLNTGPASSDDPAAVEENRRRAAEAFRVAPDRLLTPFQIHSARAAIVETPFKDERPECDALVTATPGLMLGVLTADCAPVLLADPDAGVVAAVHAGWRGALAGVIEATLDAMEKLGAEGPRVVAAVGACIGPEAYEVGPEFKERFLAESARNAALFRDGPGDRCRFDLAGYVVRRLAGAGVLRVDALGACTFSDAERWFSHRRAVKNREAGYGRNLAAILLKPSSTAS